MRNRIILYAVFTGLITAAFTGGITALRLLFSKKSNHIDYDLKNLNNKKNIIPLAILGSGPAGLSAAIYGARSGISTVMFTGPKPGGQLKDGLLIENWPGVKKDSGLNIMNQLEKQAQDFGVTIVNKTIKDIDLSTWPFKIDDCWALSLIIATGSTPKQLGVKNEQKYWIKGILSCPLCDAHLIKNKNTVVIGGGDFAVERVIQLSPYAKGITLLLTTGKVRAIYDMYKKIKDFPHVKILFNKDIESFQGDEKRLTGINIIDTKTGERSHIKTKWAFLSIGFKPNSELFKDYLDLDDQGYIKHDPKNQATKIQGIYVAGNVSDITYKQASTASGDGTKAAASAIKFLSNILVDKEVKTFIKQNEYNQDQEKLLKINDINSLEQFDEIIKQDKYLFIEFYSPLCSLCKSVEDIVSSLAYKYKDKIKFYKIDLIKNKEITKKYNVSLIPEFFLFKDSKLIARKTELLNENQISEFIDKGLNLKNGL